MNLGSFLKSVFYLVRVYNLAIIALTQYFAVWFLSKSSFVDLDFQLASWATLFLAAGGYVINDYYDVKIDAVNRPEEVVIDFKLNRRWALLGYFVANALGLLLASATLSIPIVMLCAFNSWLLWYYSHTLKRTPLWGNLAVSFLTASVLLVLIPIFPSSAKLLLSFAIFSFFMTLIREIIKDMEDVKGDKRYGCRTLPIIYGYRKTKVVIFSLTAVFAIISLIISAQVGWFLTGAITIILLPCIEMLRRLYFADTRKKFHQLSTFIKWIMLGGISTMPLAGIPLGQ